MLRKKDLPTEINNIKAVAADVAAVFWQ